MLLKELTVAALAGGAVVLGQNAADTKVTPISLLYGLVF